MRNLDNQTLIVSFEMVKWTFTLQICCRILNGGTVNMLISQDKTYKFWLFWKFAIETQSIQVFWYITVDTVRFKTTTTAKNKQKPHGNHVR